MLGRSAWAARSLTQALCVCVRAPRFVPRSCRPETIFVAAPVMTPWLAFSPMVCRDHVRFDPLIFLNLCGLLILMPAVVHGTNRRAFPRAFAAWVLVRRWTCPGTYDKMVAELHLPRTTLVSLCTTTLKLFVDACGDLVTVPDALRIRPQLAQWAHHVQNLTQSSCQHIVAWIGAWLCAASPLTTRAHVPARRAPALLLLPCLCGCVGT